MSEWLMKKLNRLSLSPTEKLLLDSTEDNIKQLFCFPILSVLLFQIAGKLNAR